MAAGALALLRELREELTRVGLAALAVLSGEAAGGVGVWVGGREEAAAERGHRTASFSRAEWHWRLTATGREAMWVG